MTRVLRFSGVRVVSTVLRFSDSRSCWSPARSQLAEQTPQQRPPVFRGESVLVTVDVYPQRDGKIVEGLKAADFRDPRRRQAADSRELRVRPRRARHAGVRAARSQQRSRKCSSSPPIRTTACSSCSSISCTSPSTVRTATRRPMVDALNRIIGPERSVRRDDAEHRSARADARPPPAERRRAAVEVLGVGRAPRNRHRSDRPDGRPAEGLLPVQAVGGATSLCSPGTCIDNGQQRYLYEVLIDRRREDRTLSSLERLIERLAGMREAQNRRPARDRGLAAVHDRSGPGQSRPVSMAR